MGAEIVRRYQEGSYIYEIADELSITKHRVRLALREAGIKGKPGLHPSRVHSRWVDPDGYVVLRKPRGEDSIFDAMQSKHGRVREHRFVLACSLGRPLRRDESAHHKNGNRTDNRLENLELFTSQGHVRGARMRCRCCGSIDLEFY